MTSNEPIQALAWHRQFTSGHAPLPHPAHWVMRAGIAWQQVLTRTSHRKCVVYARIKYRKCQKLIG
ncbi:hypothetical protein [Diaphorobacter sp.]|uniref:hypothetical protein n=1 Tax=Diaphorobacter sp. TaxID=1934310 RepID=UPI0028A689B8|nr:hypothetical protein [Diaphorobacter sp.]